MSCPTRTYQNITLEQWDKLRGIAHVQGVELDGPGGTASFDGCTFEWAYDGSTATVTCTKHPFYLSCDFINAKLDEILGATPG